MRLILALTAATIVVACAPMAGETPSRDLSADQCRASASQSLIGTNVAAVSFPEGANVRIVCTTCPTTKDLRPDRLNIRFDQASGIIRRVDCG